MQEPTRSPMGPISRRTLFGLTAGASLALIATPGIGEAAPIPGLPHHANQGGTVNPLDSLTPDRFSLTKVENVSVAVGHELTLFSQTGPGYVKTLWMALGGGNTPALDARLRVYYDGAGTPDIDIDFGTLLATHWGANGSLWTPHVHVEIAADYSTSFLFGFPMPYGRSIRIAYFLPSGTQTAYVYSMTTWAPTSTDTTGGQRLRFSGVRYIDQAITRQPGDVNVILDTAATGRSGPGHIVHHSYVGGVDAHTVTPGSANNQSWLERNIAIYLDGETSPSIESTGTEDWFDSGWYYHGDRDYNAGFHSYVGTDNPSGQPNTVAMATDLWSKWGGVPFQHSAIMRILTEPACVTGDRFCYCVLYYQ